MFYKSVIRNNLMMTLYFSCLLEWTELLIDIFCLIAFSKVSFRDGHDKLALTLNLFFMAFSGYFCILIFPRSPSYDLCLSYIFHTYSLQLVCDNIPFMLLNITDHSVVIDKLRQDKSGQELWYFRYIFISKVCFCVLMVQISDSPLCSSN